MSSVITIENLPARVTPTVFKRILIENRIRWNDFKLEPSPQDPDHTLTAHVWLSNPKEIDSALSILNETEVSDRVLQAAMASEETAELFQSKKATETRSIAPPERSESSERFGTADEEEEYVEPPIDLSDDDEESEEEVEEVIALPFASLGLSPTVLANILALGFETATPIQEMAIPPALEGCDLIGKAQTGTGKTLAFAIPVVERLLATPGKGIRALILAPTRELAVQIKDEVDKIVVNTPLRAVVVYGGDSIAEQIKELMKGCDILVATPGRLLDIQGRGRLRFDAAEILVLDEADRMLDMGFIPQIRIVIQCFYEHPQTLLFSATIPKEIQKLTGISLKNPVLVDAGTPDLTPLDTVTQEVLYVSQEEKERCLHKILDKEEGSVLVFTRTKRATERLYQKLKLKGYPVTRIHGDIEQSDRMKAVELFRQGRFNILVGTDVVARGIDIKGIAHVVNYDLPPAPEDHLHRIGRTARAGASGKATTFVTHAERKTLRSFKSVLGQ